MMDVYYNAHNAGHLSSGMFGGSAPLHPLSSPAPSHSSCSIMQAPMSDVFNSEYMNNMQAHSIGTHCSKSPTPFGVQDILGMPQVEQSRHHKVPVVHIAKRYDGNRNSSFGAAFVSEDDYDKIVATADVLDEVTALRLGLEYEATIPIGPLRRHRKERKARTVFTNDQLQLLENRFRSQPRLSSLEREELAEQIQLSATQIRVWFQNKRAKMKRDKMQVEEEGHQYSNSVI
ncbi:transcription factor LBX2-like [Bolinopsis microptera]|uniref:transcription factor LBX2-like n=1 Tax=Bolinopsis microptera TaxID=2820187 RepID=UPI00307A27F1